MTYKILFNITTIYDRHFASPDTLNNRNVFFIMKNKVLFRPRKRNNKKCIEEVQDKSWVDWNGSLGYFMSRAASSWDSTPTMLNLIVYSCIVRYRLRFRVESNVCKNSGRDRRGRGLSRKRECRITGVHSSWLRFVFSCLVLTEADAVRSSADR